MEKHDKHEACLGFCDQNDFYGGHMLERPDILLKKICCDRQLKTVPEAC